MTLPADAVPLHRWTLHDVTDLAALRAALQTVLTGRAPAAMATNLVLAASELAANAIRHGLPPTQVILLHYDSRYVVDVTDHDVRHAPTAQAPDHSRTSGRGLQIVAALTREGGWYTAAGLKHVWASFTVTGR